MQKLITFNLQELLAADFPAQEKILDPWLPTRGLAMISAFRGSGKTFLGLGISYTIARGGELLTWRAPKPRSVLYVDGEMDPAEVRNRVAAMHRGAGFPEFDWSRFNIAMDQIQPGGIASLSDPSDSEPRRQVEEAIAKTQSEVLQLDNLSCLTNSSNENEVASWNVMQDWLLKLRSQGTSVIMYHHTGKPNAEGWVSQRGTSKKEDILNSTLLLKQGRTGDRFNLYYDKRRGFVPEWDWMECKISWPEPSTAEEPLELQFIKGHKKGERGKKEEAGDDTPKPQDISKVGALVDAGMSVRAIADILGLSQGKVQRACASYKKVREAVHDKKPA